ncbi:hypothetical protein quinque_009738 [Culex quinquefasciatus]
MAVAESANITIFFCNMLPCTSTPVRAVKGGGLLVGQGGNANEASVYLFYDAHCVDQCERNNYSLDAELKLHRVRRCRGLLLDSSEQPYEILEIFGLNGLNVSIALICPEAF